MCRCLLASRSRVHVCTLIRYPVFDIISMMRLSALAAFFIQYHGFLLQIWWKGHRLESLPPLPLPFERGYWWRRDECGAWRETSRKCVYMLSAWSVGKYISVKLAHNAGLYRCHGSSVQDPPNKIFHVGGYLFHKCICSAQFQQVLEWGLRWSVAFFVQCINKPLWSSLRHALKMILFRIRRVLGSQLVILIHVQPSYLSPGPTTLDRNNVKSGRDWIIRVLNENSRFIKDQNLFSSSLSNLLTQLSKPRKDHPSLEMIELISF